MTIYLLTENIQRCCLAWLRCSSSTTRQAKKITHLSPFTSCGTAWFVSAYIFKSPTCLWFRPQVDWRTPKKARKQIPSGSWLAPKHLSNLTANMAQRKRELFSTSNLLALPKEVIKTYWSAQKMLRSRLFLLCADWSLKGGKFVDRRRRAFSCFVRFSALTSLVWLACCSVPETSWFLRVSQIKNANDVTGVVDIHFGKNFVA